MPYSSSYDTGQATPWALYEADLTNVSAVALATNTAYLVGVYLPVSATLTAIRVSFGTGGTGNFDVGIYDSNGNALYRLGSTATATGIQTKTLATALPLSQGRYWLAFWVDNATDTVRRAPGVASMMPVQAGTVAGGLPSATSGITGLTNQASRPVIIGLLQGGWS